MGYKRDCRIKKEKRMRDFALSEKKKHDKDLKGKKTVLVPHPDLPRTWIEKVIDE